MICLIPGRLTGYIDWLQSQKHSTDVYENKRYAIVNPDDDVLIGMVGMGLEDTLNEVEMAYFILTIDCANAASCSVAKKQDFNCMKKDFL